MQHASSSTCLQRHQRGTTLLEVLLVLAIVAVLITTALPAGRHLTIKQDIISDTQQLRQALTLARSTAIMTQHTVILCPSHDGRQCDNDWSAPLILRDTQSADILHRFPAARTTTIRFRNDDRAVRFQPTGRASGHNGTFVICADNGRGRVLVLSNFGRIREQPASRSRCSQSPDHA
ncbi:GspH/FimT family protein [Halomonas huangheensis]|uniref:Type II secretion system protein H n=1 Tax=Halomonas huangheensis TaxID=1178482 RepID=W1N413_9GAMM|nr:GspH/FimT family pseudopilin [Halomonas huangheensis]ALM51273.1 hypothetical protein AR456_02415 [Halomonas huangheensis]ERL49700.1 hypothetical protein BJB45_00855 [Halomonas huangheensis]